MVKCLECNGNCEYVVEQRFKGKVYPTVVKCQACNGEGKIMWSHFCAQYKKVK